ncbi:hypothetical protein K504DRAFT_505180 [Pleomassaria siparia CBS 279.74]|uniref:Uncharacterized protein n=1 Tax=Pleomassaria siparia CBS 279.74 TaxID=1314801 RepID=A0A6G1K123_9PLEO|nr:hypothetical protein K504DRAFT_505180 [Pleomassaria siparia CBS 279.74]
MEPKISLDNAVNAVKSYKELFILTSTTHLDSVLVLYWFYIIILNTAIVTSSMAVAHNHTVTFSHEDPDSQAKMKRAKVRDVNEKGESGGR